MHRPTHCSWDKMKQRCLNPNHHKYPSYGSRGITVCPEWYLYANFLRDMGERPAGTSLDRIDVDGNYAPGNCRWATSSEQQRNKRGFGVSSFRGVSPCGIQWRAYLTVDGKRKHIGVYPTQELAFAARLEAERVVGYP